MPTLSPITLTQDEQKLILRATSRHLRDHTIISVALGTGLRLGEIVGLNVGDVYAPNGTPFLSENNADHKPVPVNGLATFRRDRFGPGVSGIPNVASSRHTSPTAFAAVTATSSSHAALR